jgi:uncharacterized protein YhaN
MMNFTDLRVDGFGVWSGLELRGLSPTLNVFYGPNEAGKTTLLNFVRSVLYGFSPDRRARYLPPARGGQAGGLLGISTGHGTFRVSRHPSPDVPLGAVAVAAADGTVQGEPRLHALLGDVDETIFHNIFAVGLDELQELGTLDGTSAARLLYDLSAGMDRVSLVEVLRELETSRVRLLAPDERPSQITELMAQRDRLRAELDELGTLTRRFWRLGGEHDALADSIEQAEADVANAERESRRTEVAVALAPRWDAQQELDSRLAALGPLEKFPPDALRRMQEITAALTRRQERLARIAKRRRPIRKELAGLKIRMPLWEQSARIEALAEHESWITSVEEELRKADAEVASWEARHTAGLGRLGLKAQATPNQSNSVSHAKLTTLRGPAADLRRAVRAAREARKGVVDLQQNADAQQRTVAEALTTRGQKDLNPTLEQAGALVSQLRRRVQLDDRLDRMTRHRTDLDEQIHGLMERQILPGWILASLGGAFVLGVLLVFIGLTWGSVVGSWGWPLALLGLVAFATAAGTKWMLETNAQRQLEGCHKQVALLETQTKQAQDERTELDKQLPSGGGPLATRLQAAEAAVTKLEAMLPLEARHQTAQQDLATAQKQATDAKEALQKTHGRWRAALVAAGMPKNLSPKQLREMVGHRTELDGIERGWSAAVEQRDRRARELGVLAARIESLLHDADLKPEADNASGRLRQLRRELAEEESKMGRRDALRKRLVALRGRRFKDRRAVRRLHRHRLALLRGAAAGDEAEFIRRANERVAADGLLQQRDTLHREFVALCTPVASEAEMAAHLSGTKRDDLESLRRQAAEHLTAARATLRALCEQRGHLGHQLKMSTDDRRPALKQLELNTVEQRLNEALQRWRVLAVTGSVLQSLKEDYERNRQPEALREASEYLRRLTGGRYARIWTPWGEDVLHVDDELSQSLGVERLSRGTREQLFLSLRMAIASLYARRGAAMPLVLDDVLVNFDADRSARAATVLRDFAAEGHQLLVFTCHEHIARLFKSLDVRVRRFPNHVDLSGSTELPESSEEPPVEPALPRKRRTRAPKVTPEPVVEIQETPSAHPPYVEPVYAEPTYVAPKPVEDPVLPAMLIEPPEPVKTKPLPIAVELEEEPIELSEPAIELPEPASLAALTNGATFQHRADLPHRRVILRHVRHHWNAEEFDGELDDRVADETVAEGFWVREEQ